MRANRFFAFALFALSLYAWSLARIPRMSAFQEPPHPQMHGNYYTFHDMSEQWDAGKRPGTLNATKNSEYSALANPYVDYGQFAPKGTPAFFCDYYELDIGFLFPVDIARHMFAVILPDSFLRTLALQVLVDLLALGALFGVLWAWGWLPATAAAMMYGLNYPLASQASLTFYYFWDAIVALTALLIIVGLYSSARRRIFSWRSAATALGLGLLLGCGVWLRSSWVAYSLVLITLLFCVRRIRPYVVIAAIALIASAAYPIVRASRFLGAPAMTTRQGWSAAFEALGKDPNPYGLENFDQYLFDVASEKYGAVDAACQSTKRDNALKQEYLRIWRADPGFIVRSIANRMYLGFFSNGGWGADADRQALFFALIGAVWMIFRGGARRWMAIPALALFFVSTATICLAFMMTGGYNGVSQVCLILLGAGAFDLIGYFVPRQLTLKPLIRRLHAVAHLARHRTWPLIVVGGVLMLLFVTLQQPAVHAYLNVPRAAVEWQAPAVATPDQIHASIVKIHGLPETLHHQLMDELQIDHAADDGVIAKALQARFRHIRGLRTDTDVTVFDLDFDAATAAKAEESLWHSERFVLGFTLEDVRGFVVENPATWSGRVLAFHVKVTDPSVLERAAPVFIEKFTRRGMRLRSRNGNAFVFES